MDETIMNTAEDQTAMSANNASSDDELKVAIEDQLKKIQRQNMLIGAQTVCTVILNKIESAMSKPGSRTMNDYKRIIKDIEKFCTVGVSRTVNADGETDQEDVETIQN